MLPHSDAIAECVLAAFKALPAKCKPRPPAGGRREWVPLAGIVLSRGTAPKPSLTCAALATGMKCLPQNKIALANGNILHDSHAEILAIRAFNRWLVDECADLAAQGTGSRGTWVEWRALPDKSNTEDGHAKNTQTPPDEHGHVNWQNQPFALHEDVGIHMYCSEAPCGDASMELTMAAQADDTPWDRDIPDPDGLLGRGYFDQLGIVRRKPARSDAPPSFSKSCSDKLALKQCTSLLSGVTSRLVHPGRCYVQTVVLPRSQCVPAAVERAFGRNGRMGAVLTEEVQSRWREAGYAFTPFGVGTTDTEFEFSRRQDVLQGETLLPSNLSVVYTPQRAEVLVNGVLQGRKQFDPRGASSLARRRMWEGVDKVLTAVSGAAVVKNPSSETTYEDYKLHDHRGREAVKNDVRDLALKGWKRNLGDESWTVRTE